MEPAAKQAAGQAGAPRGRGPSAEGPPLRGKSALTGGPVPPCAPLPSGGDFNFRSPKGEGNCAPAGATPPPVNLWPLSFDQESGDLGPGRCLTNSQTYPFPMAQSKKASQRFRQIKNRKKRSVAAGCGPPAPKEQRTNPRFINRNSPIKKLRLKRGAHKKALVFLRQQKNRERQESRKNGQLQGAGP